METETHPDPLAGQEEGFSNRVLDFIPGGQVESPSEPASKNRGGDEPLLPALDDKGISA
jgi:hypothetical protein